LPVRTFYNKVIKKYCVLFERNEGAKLVILDETAASGNITELFS